MPLLCLASPKGGVGKTTLAANLACGLAGRGARVVALDLDPQNALRLHFGVSLHDVAGLLPVLRRQGRWQSALRQTGASAWLLPYGHADLATALDDAAMLADAAAPGNGRLLPILRAILNSRDTILVVDTPPGPSAALRSLLPLADLVVTVLLADATSVALIPAVMQGSTYGPVHAADGPGRQAFVLNQVNPLSCLSRATSEAVGQQLGSLLLGTVSRDEHVAEAIANQQSVFGYAPSSRAAQDLLQLTSGVADRLQAVAQRPPPQPAAVEAGRHGHLVPLP